MAGAEYYLTCSRPGCDEWSETATFTGTPDKDAHNFLEFKDEDFLKSEATCSKNAVYYRREREGSAMRTKKSFFNKVVNECNLFLARTSILFKSPRAYSLKFYFRSIVSSIVKLVIAD